MSNTRRKKPVVNSTVTEDVKPLIEVKKVESTVENTVAFLENKIKAQDKIIVEFSDKLASVESRNLFLVRQGTKDTSKLFENRIAIDRLNKIINSLPSWIKWLYGINA